jgi:acetate kinase
MSGCISVINSGSSSIKFSLFDQIEQEEMRLIFSGQIEGVGTAPKFKAKDGDGLVIDEKQFEQGASSGHEHLMEELIDWIRARRLELGLELRGVGHRVVHGGPFYSRPVKVDDQVLAELEKFIVLAPLHQPHNLSSIRTILRMSGDIEQVACFDTAFHRTNPPEAQAFALPYELSEEGVRRYGFHGLSYEYIARWLPELAPELANGRVIVAHLGSGASMCGLNIGVSVASTMGFSAMDGLVMGTRPGNLDPGVVLYLLQEKQMSGDEIADLLYKRSGLLGISGISNDMRVLLASEDPRAKEAIEIFVYRIGREIGSLTAALGGLDGLIFTAGIGEHSPEIRQRVCDVASWLGIELDEAANGRGETLISRPQSKIAVMVIPTNEELMIATHTRDVLLGDVTV